jgi:Glycosyl transferase family 2
LQKVVGHSRKVNLDAISYVACLLGAGPCALFFVNFRLYRLTNKTKVGGNRSSPFSEQAVSVLIPARNEERNIGDAVAAVLANRDVDLEVIVMDDHSTDRTGKIVSEMSSQDSRLRLESAPILPEGWCGKQHACNSLAKLATHPFLVFIDADVRLAPDALNRMLAFVKERKVALASGVPHQQLGTFSECLLIPLIHFILLAFLPIQRMRRTTSPACSAGCGQLFVVRREAYQACGGHAAIRNSLHDGLQLPRVFRKAGFSTDLFDATDLATCRMFQTDKAVWRGLARNATEGLAAPRTILPMSIFLFGGQVLPFGLLAFHFALTGRGLVLAVLATTFALLPRAIASRRFRQPFIGVLLHPFGIIGLLFIQWSALLASLTGRPRQWRGRVYRSGSAPITCPGPVSDQAF